MVETDPEGYLVNREDWTPELAVQLAQQENITLTDAHWELVPLVQSFFDTFEHSPANRPLANWIKQHLGPDKAKTLYLRGLFPNHRRNSWPKLPDCPGPITACEAPNLNANGQRARLAPDHRGPHRLPKPLECVRHKPTQLARP